MTGRAIILLAILGLAACGQGENDPGPGGVTAGEARALDEAAQMLDARKLPPEALQPARPGAEGEVAPSPDQ